MSRNVNEARRQRRRENAGKRLKLCSRCGQRLARHRAKDVRLCCECYVDAGYEPRLASRLQGSLRDQKDTAMTGLILKRASIGSNQEDYDVVADDKVVGASSWPPTRRAGLRGCGR
jgi:hypothetical protein